jgi:hypothetical protein
VLNHDRLNVEQRAMRSLLELMESGEECRKLFERANMALPEPLKRFLGISDNSGAPVSQVVIPPLEKSPRPPEARADWVWIHQNAATPSVLVPAILRGESPMRARDVIEHIQAFQPKVSRGTINNVGTRLDNEDVIGRSEEGWWLADPDKGAVLFQEHVWGPAEVFGKPELAAHRREAIVHLLRLMRGGLQMSQILEQLKTCTWMKAPISKELIQDDVELLAEQNRIRRRGNSRKWELSQGEES